MECGGRGRSFSPWDQGKEPRVGRVPYEVILSSLMPPGPGPQTKQALPVDGFFWGRLLLPSPSLSSTLHSAPAVPPPKVLTPLVLPSLGRVTSPGPWPVSHSLTAWVHQVAQAWVDPDPLLSLILNFPSFCCLIICL